MTALPSLGDESIQALEVVDGLDRCLQTGVARLTESEKGELDALASALVGTPLAGAVADAVNGLKRGQYSEGNLSALAAARTALLGAVYDVLIQQIDLAFSFSRSPAVEPPSRGDPLPVQMAVRHMLIELAVAGFRHVSSDTLASFDQTLDALLDEPALIRLAVLLSGLINELNSTPPALMEQMPVRRWADLWSRAMIMTLGAPSIPEPGPPSSGELFILGVDVLRHPSFVTLNLYGLFENEEASLVTFSLSSHSVGSIVGLDVWMLFDQFPVLKQALAEGTSLKLHDMPALENGVLLWDDHRAKKGEPYDLFQKAARLSGCERTKLSPSERHPVHICELLVLDTCAYEDGCITSGDLALNVDARRLTSLGPLDEKALKGIRRAVGLLRYDGDWSFQPLAVEKVLKKELTVIHNGLYSLGDPKAKKRKGNGVTILRERASRLLRK
jgi:hypothetical protein